MHSKSNDPKGCIGQGRENINWHECKQRKRKERGPTSGNLLLRTNSGWIRGILAIANNVGLAVCLQAIQAIQTTWTVTSSRLWGFQNETSHALDPVWHREQTHLSIWGDKSPSPTQAMDGKTLPAMKRAELLANPKESLLRAYRSRSLVKWVTHEWQIGVGSTTGRVRFSFGKLGFINLPQN